MLDVKKKLEDEIKTIEANYEILINDNCSSIIKSIALKKIIVLYERIKQIAKCENVLLDERVNDEEEKYFNYYLAYQEGKVLKDNFYSLVKNLLNLSDTKYDFLTFRFNSGYSESKLKNIESSFSVLIEREKLLELKEMDYYQRLDVFEFKRCLTDYFNDGGEGLVFSSTHCLDFEFHFKDGSFKVIDTVDGNPIYFVQNIKDSYFSCCVNEAMGYVKEYGFDHVDSPVSKIKKVKFNCNNNRS